MPAASLRLRLTILPAITVLLISACAGSRARLTPVSAGTLAARLANDRCLHAYGKTPFAPDDFEAALDNGRWHWGTPDGGKVDGFEVEVSFDPRGGAQRVDVHIPPE